MAAWFWKKKDDDGERPRKVVIAEGLWVKCGGCSAQLYRAELKRNLFVCPKCAHHMRVGARERLELFLDPNSGYEIAAGLEPLDPLKFKDSKRYRERLSQAQKERGWVEAIWSPNMSVAIFCRARTSARWTSSSRPAVPFSTQRVAISAVR